MVQFAPVDLTDLDVPADGMEDLTETEDPNSVPVRERALTFSLLSEDNAIDEDRVFREAELGESFAKEEMRAKANSTVDVRKSLEQGMINQVPLEDLERIAQRAIGKTKELNQAEDILAEDILMAGDDYYSEAEYRYARRTAWATQFIAEKIRQNSEDKSFGGKVFDFIDRYLIRQIPIGSWEDFTNKKGQKGVELLSAAVTDTMTDQEYQAYFTQYVSELEAEGLFRGENLFALMQGLEELESSGFNPYREIELATGAFELATLGLTAASKLTKVTRAMSSLQKVVAVEGAEVAAEAGAKKVIKKFDPEVMDDLAPSSHSVNNRELNANSSRVQEIIENNTLFQKVRDIYKSGASGRLADDLEVDRIAAQVVERIGKRTARPVANTIIREAGVLGEKKVQVLFGKKNGAAPLKESSAKKVASTVDGAKVVPADPANPSKGYYVSVEERLDLTDVSDPLEFEKVFQNTTRELVSKYLGSVPLRDSERLAVLAQMGEASASAYKAAAREQLSKIESLWAKDRSTLTKVFEELRDGPKAAQREYFSEEEFIDAWKRYDTKGLEPSQKVKDAYIAMKELSDTAWLIEASRSLQRYVAHGYNGIKLSDELIVPAKKVDTIPDDALIFDAKNKANRLTAKEVLETKNPRIWKLEKPLDDGSEYVVDPLDVKLLDYEDVFGFNAGGRRANQPANYFVMLAGKGGKSLRPKAMLTAFTGKKAERAVEELRTLASAQADGKLTDELVQANNSWNPDIETVADFQALQKEKRWDLTRDIEIKERDQRIDGVDELNPFASANAEDFFRNDTHRGDEVLMEYGGGKVLSADPVSAIADQFGSATNQLAMRAYSIKAINSWLKGAAKMGGIKLDPSLALNPREQFATASFVGKSPRVARAKEMHDIIMRRLSMKSELQSNLDRLGQTILESVDDKFGVQISKPNIEGKLLQLGFQNAFGFLNVSQFFMQAAHASVIMTLSPIHGTAGLARAIPMRMMLSLEDIKTEAEAVRRFAKAANMTFEDADQLVTYIKTSGRAIVDGDAVELGTGVGSGVSGWRGESFISNITSEGVKGIKKGLHVGLTPFREGERLSRLTAINTAYAEFRAIKAHEGISVLSDYGRSWMTRREQELNFNMTTGSRPFFQSGLMKVPTQWMSYSFRAMEAIAFGSKGISPAQRARLFGSLAVLYGLTGMGFEKYTDYAAEKLGVDPDSDINNLIRFGVLDYAVSQTTGTDTALAGRLSPFTIIPETYKKITQESTATAAFGPSGEITGSVLEAVTSVLGDFAMGRPAHLGENAIRVLRQPSGIDNVFKAYGIWNQGVYRSKNGIKFEGELKSSDAIQQIFGFTPAEILEIQQRRTEMYLGTKDFNAFRKEMERKAGVAWDLFQTNSHDDNEKGAKLLNEIFIQVDFAPLSERQKQSIRKSLLNRNQSILTQLTRFYTQEMNTFAINRTQKILGEQ